MKRKELVFINQIPYKECGICKKIHPLENFTKRRNRPTGNYCCKQCHKEKNVIARKDKIKKYKEENHKKILQSYKEYHKKNKDKQKIWYKEYWKKPLSKLMSRLRTAKRRHLAKITNDGTITGLSVYKLLESQHRKCKICECCLKENKYHLDHIIPLYKGGPHSISNIQGLCQHCNQIKFIN